MTVSTTMKSGEFFVGDLCYVLRMHWEQVCDTIFENNTGLQGAFELNEETFVSFFTMYGDGRYQDQLGNNYPVDAGLIGTISLESLEKLGYTHTFEYLNKMGAVHKYDEDFECSVDGEGCIRFGHITIETGEKFSDDSDY